MNQPTGASMDLDTGSAFEIQELLAEVLSLIEWPAALVCDGTTVLECNTLWSQRLPLDPKDGPVASRDLADFLRGFTLIQGLAEVLRDGSFRSGVITAFAGHGLAGGGGAAGREFKIRWRRLRARPGGRALALVVLQSVSTAGELASTIATQHTQIDQLLIRQTLIEEDERRRIGQELHDSVAQVLAQVRGAIESGLCTGSAIPEWRSKVDRVIGEIRTLSFELSPPILEQLGLRPALSWLAEHLGTRYKANVEFIDDGKEPPLSSKVRTILFRSVRELAINSAKHAPGAEVVLSCVSDERFARIIVKDTGPGFDTSRVHASACGKSTYGLLSVEQQIRGIGGSFEIVSAAGEGTRAVITVPVEPGKETA